MGWYYSHYSRSDLIKELTKPFKNDIHKTTCLKHCTRGNILWTIWERTFTDPKKKTQRFIGCDLMQVGEGMWGYKPMDESVHPCYYTCPIRYLEMTKDPNTNLGYRKDWRDEVHRIHKWKLAKRRAKKALTKHVEK